MERDNVLPETIQFHFGPEEPRLEISLIYTTKETLFSVKFGEKESSQSFVNLWGDPTVLNILSNKEESRLDEAYPNEAERIRFVKGVLYLWSCVKLGHMDLLGVYSKLIDKKKTFEDFAHKEMIEIVIVPVLKSIRDGRRHLPDMPEPILRFAESASREISEYLYHEVDILEIFNEDEVKGDFREKLNQVNATLAIRAVQALAASDIDKISEIGNTIQDLQDRKVDVPEFQLLKEEFRGLCDKIKTLDNGNVQVQVVQQSSPSPDLSSLLEEITSDRERIKAELDAFKETVKGMEANIEETKKEFDRERTHNPSPQPSDHPSKIMRNLSRKQLKVIEKMFSEN
jgi:hypothetical protein